MMVESSVLGSMPIFISTGGAKGISATSVARDLITNGLNRIELSGGIFVENISNELANLKGGLNSLMIHNYFPIPENHFVMNLASMNHDIFTRTRNHIIESIKLTSEIDSKFYAVHAGFLLDPSPSELGNLIKKRMLVDRRIAYELFVERFCNIADIAISYGVRLLVENNVFSHQNLQEQGENSLLLVEPQEILDFIADCDGKAGLLLDLGHLKVSSTTLRFDLIEAISILNPIVEGYHLHDNDSISDEHKTFTNETWFISKLKRDAHFYTLEIHSLDIPDILSSVKILKESLEV